MKKRYWLAILCVMLALVLTVAAASADGGDEYKLMTDVSELHDGDRIILVSDNGEYYQAMATDFSGVQVIVTSNAITEQDGMLPLTLVETVGGWLLTADAGYLSADGNWLILATDQADAAIWSIMIASDDTATISCVDGNLVFVEQDGAYRFSCGTGGNEVVIYYATYELEQHVFGDGLWWTFENGKLTIGGSGNMPNFSSSSDQPWASIRSEITEVEILDGVTSIGSYVFSSCTGLQSITIPDGVTSIGSYAFSGCTGLQSITLPDSVTIIGDHAFMTCTGLLNFTVPGGVTTIYNFTFDSCAGLKSITIPDNVRSIGENAFSGCTRLMEITIPDSVESVGNNAFYECTGLTSITMPCSANIRSNTFQSCTAITIVHLTVGTGTMENYYSSTYYYTPWYKSHNNALTITLDEGIQRISDWAFHNCTGLSEITIPDSVTSIGENAFSGCTGFSEITIPYRVTGIGSDAFSGCTGLTSITIPGSVTYIGWYAFQNCTGLTEITIPDGVTNIGKCAFADCTGLTSITIGNGIEVISSAAFSNTAWWNAQNDGVVYLDNILLGVKGTCGQIVRVKDGTRLIAYNAFSSQVQITKVTIPDSVTSIGSEAFDGCTGLTSVTIGNGVTNIVTEAFYGCTGLTTITLPCSANIGTYAFYNCTAIKSVHLTEGNGTMTRFDNSSYKHTPWAVSRSNVLTIVLDDGIRSIGDYAFYGCTGLTEITIPNSVISIGNYAFYGCTGLSEITIPDGVRNIDKNVFYGCTGLTEIRIPDNVISIGEYAFYGCTGLSEIMIPDGVVSIGECAFYGCTGPSEITIPDSVTSIGGRAFYGWIGLTEITIPDGVTSIGGGAFSGCTGLQSITMPCSASIGYGAFYGCTSITSVHLTKGTGTMPSYTSVLYSSDSYSNTPWYNSRSNALAVILDEGIQNISNYAFYECTGLTSITIPDSVTILGQCAFRECTGLMSVTIPNGVTSIEYAAFSNCTGLTDVYYLGTEVQKNWISFGGSNDPLLNATWHYIAIAFKTQALTLEGKIGVNFFVDLPQIDGIEYEGVAFTIDSVDGADAFVPFSGEGHPTNGSGYYQFTYYVRTIEMANTITATLRYTLNGEDQTLEKTYSVRQYFEAIEPNLSSYPAKVRNMIKATADLGHYIQAFLAAQKGWTFGTDYAEMDKYYTDYTADEISAAQTDLETNYKISKTVGSNMQKITYTLVWDSDTELRVYFKPAATYTGTFTFTANGDPITENGEKISAALQPDGRYLVSIKNIAAHELTAFYTIKAIGDGVESVMTVSPLSYVRSVMANYASDPTAVNAAVAFYRYAMAAYALKYGN